MAITIISWNIYHFSTNRAGAALGTANAHRCNIILDLVNPVAGPLCDVFVILETKTNAPYLYNVVGELGVGDGITATRQLLAALQGRTPTWEVVPPVYLTARTKAEAISVFFNSATVTLNGPLTDAALVAGSPWRTAATQSGAGTFKGQASFENPAGTAVVFHANQERRPYLVDFTEVASGTRFSVLAHHSPSPKNTGANIAARAGTSALAGIREVTTTRNARRGVANAPVIIVGDFNCCGVHNCPPPGFYAQDITAQDPLTGLGGIGYTHGQSAMTSIRRAITATTQHEAAVAAAHLANVAAVPNAAAAALNAAAAQAQAQAAAIAAQAQAQAARAAAMAAGTAANDAADALTAVLGPGPALINAAVTAARTACVAALATAVSGAGQPAATYAAEAATAAGRALAARNAALAISDTFNANTTAYLQALARAAHHAADAIDAPAGSAAHATLVGTQLTHAINAVTPVPNATAARLAAGPVVTNTTVAGGITNANGVVRAKAARDSALALGEALYITHIGASRSSLKSTAAPTAYLSHAFDHVLTIGASGARNARVIDLVPGTITRYHTVAFAPGMALGSFRAGYKYIAIYGSKGVSDHLPVSITVDL